jgi:S1-C subfamily serine protease
VLTAQTTREGDAQLVEIRAGQTANVILTSHGQGTIEGSVLDFRTRAPIANATCMVVMAVDGQRGIASWDFGTAPRSDARGRVMFDPAPAGSASVTCEMPSPRWSQASADVTLAAGGRATVQLLSVEMTENPGATGIAFDQRVTAPRVASVLAGSTAAKAGVQPGDLVTAVGGASVVGLNGTGVQRLINSRPIGDDVKLTVVRAGATRTMTVKVVAENL